MDSIVDEYSHYWETDRELDNWDDVVEVLVNYSSSSPMGSNSSVASSSLGAQDLSSAAAAEDMGLEGRSEPSSGMLAKNILTERNRRKRFNDSLYALRSVVPTITKLDKVSIVKDAIDYIESLQQQEGVIMAEISENEELQAVACGGGVCRNAGGQVQQPQVARLQAEPRITPKKKKKKNQDDDVVALAAPTVASFHNLRRRRAESVPATNRSPLQLMEMKVVPVKERTWLVSLTYKKDKHTMLSLCELFALLHLKTLSVNITTLSGRVQQMVMVECDELDIDMLQERIHNTITGQKLQRNTTPQLNELLLGLPTS